MRRIERNFASIANQLLDAGGWKSAQHLFNTYLHADEDATVTDRLFDVEINNAKERR